MSRRRLVRWVLRLGALWLASLPASGAAQTGEGAPEAPRSGGDRSRTVHREVRDTELIPLTRIDVDADVTGNLAHVTVEQVYENRLQGRVEAVYVFPLPDDAAVNEMVMIIGDRRIVADLRERNAARQAYEQARDQGRSASLLEQERPNVFTMSVANIEPGQPISVRISYVEEVPFRDGRYRFHVPTVVGPRFIPGTPIGQAGTGVLRDTDAVPDASRITPSVLPRGVRTPYEVAFHLDLNAPMAIGELASSSHNLALQRVTDQHATADLLPGERQPNRDIDLSYALASTAPAAGLLVHRDDERGGFFTLMLEPPLDFSQQDVRPKELVFVLDASGSMEGAPIETSKAAVRHALRHLNPGDTFQIVRFSDAASGLSPIPLANSPSNVERALRFLDTVQGEGGTMMTAGIEAALLLPPDPTRMRIVLFLTDGYIGNEDAILDLVQSEIGDARLFSLGVGSSVNRSLLDRMADAGRGAVQYVDAGARTGQVVRQFYARFRNPILTDISIDWGGLDVSQQVPERISDVFSGTPISIAGRFATGGQATVTVRGKHGQRPIEIPLQVTLPVAPCDNPAVAHLWARRRIDELELRNAATPAAVAGEVLRLALQFRIMSQYTSFVAVEERLSADARDPLHTVAVPVALPAGTSDRLMGPQVQPAQASSAVVGLSAANQVGTAVGYGGLGSSGTGRGAGGSGGGSGTGRGAGGLRGHRAVAPSIRTGTAEVRGSLSRDIIRRYVRRYMNRIRGCYERELARSPGLAGRVVIRFVIGPAGRVTTATVGSSTLGSSRAERCMIEAISEIEFPQVEGGGVVIVSYPLVFQAAPQPPRQGTP